ncbi:MAG: hypothetical protein GYA55_05830, partial [SAR324 cluster bacterium]|nr:hypothetical protein [SAR324 cluster bacterium]
EDDLDVDRIRQNIEDRSTIMFSRLKLAQVVLSLYCPTTEQDGVASSPLLRLNTLGDIECFSCRILSFGLVSGIHIDKTFATKIETRSNMWPEIIPSNNCPNETWLN